MVHGQNQLRRWNYSVYVDHLFHRLRIRSLLELPHYDAIQKVREKTTNAQVRLSLLR